MIITYKQCKAARELLGWSREDLEKKAKISRSTLADFERGARNLRMDNYEKILKAFDGGGIKFVNNEEGVGAIEINNK
ncbi:MAG: transcriptional regulator with XRE-family HTH domain [Rickettsiales bacterium]|jgi:transcriptional regulator with XRE-family HTH domain